MVSFPNCKINLGLNIVSKRNDGYHNLETVFYPIDLKDALEVIEASEFKFTMSGLPVQGNAEDNLCVKAYRLLKQDFSHLPNVHIHLQKAIPMGAGLGGGSSDGAFMLQLLNKKFELNITEQHLLEYALKLGSDCPFFIINKPCFATGRGEILETVDINLSSYKIVLINPGIHVSTADAFAALTPAFPELRIRDIIKEPIEKWRNSLHNDFEKTVFEKHDEIPRVKEALYEQGATYASMTGTGSTVYGLFETTLNPTFSFPENYLVIAL